MDNTEQYSFWLYSVLLELIKSWYAWLGIFIKNIVRDVALVFEPGKIEYWILI